MKGLPALHLQHNLAELLALFEKFMSLPAFRKREHAVNDRPELPTQNELQHREQFRAAAHERTEQREISREEIAQIKLAVVSRRRAAGHEPPIIRKAEHAFFPRCFADVLEHD